MRRLRLLCCGATFAVLALSGHVGCNCGSTPPACVGDCVCTGSTCECQAGGTCTFGGGVDGGADPGGLPSNVTFDCEQKNTCNVSCGTGCTSHCANDTTCVGTCGSNCTTSCAARSTCTQTLGEGSTAQCTGTSSCTVTTGAGSEVTCAGGSTCNVTLEPGSTLECQGTSTCTVSCPDGGCTVHCAGDSKCSCQPSCTLNCNVADAGAGPGGVRTPKRCDGGLTCVRNDQCP